MASRLTESERELLGFLKLATQFVAKGVEMHAYDGTAVHGETVLRRLEKFIEHAERGEFQGGRPATPDVAEQMRNTLFDPAGPPYFIEGEAYKAEDVYVDPDYVAMLADLNREADAGG